MEDVYFTSHFGKSPYVIAWDGSYSRYDTEEDALQEFPRLRTLKGIPAEESDFRYLPLCKREMVAYDYIRTFPPYIFEKKFVFHPPKGWLDSFLDDYFRTTPSKSPDPINSHLIIGAQSPKTLLSLVLASGCIFSGDKEKFYQRIVPKYFIAIDDNYDFGTEEIDLYSFMLTHNVKSDSDTEIRHTKTFIIPDEKRWTKIKDQPVFLPPYIYQAQLLLTENNILNPERSRAETIWINIGAGTKQELDNLIDFLQIRSNTINNEKTASRERISDEVKMYVWKRDNGKCVMCGSQDKLEFDHIIPLSMGGSNTARNIQLLCERCNRSKGANIG